MLKLAVALTLATVAAQDAAPRPWQEFMSQGLNVGIGGMNKGITTGLAFTKDDPKPGTSEIVTDFSSFGAEGAQGFGNLASGIPVVGPAAAAGAGAIPMPKAAGAEAAEAMPMPKAAADPTAVPSGALEGFGGDKPFLDNTAFQPTNLKAHLGTEQEFLNAAALTSINFGNLAHKHGNLYGNGKGDGGVSALIHAPTNASMRPQLTIPALVLSRQPRPSSLRRASTPPTASSCSRDRWAKPSSRPAAAPSSCPPGSPRSRSQNTATSLPGSGPACPAPWPAARRSRASWPRSRSALSRRRTRARKKGRLRASPPATRWSEPRPILAWLGLTRYLS